MKLKSSIAFCTSVASLILLAAGCTTNNPAAQSSTKAAPLKVKEGIQVDLKAFQIATVVPFGVPTDKNVDPSVGAKFANDVAARLQYDFGKLFQEVRQGTPLNQTNELVVGGTITSYKPGDRFARAMLIGLGAASFKGELQLKDAHSNQMLLEAPFDKLWAWGGYVGAGRGIEEMEGETAAAVAATVARAKGWTPPAPPAGKKH